LTAIEAYTRDVGRGIARIDYDPMDYLGATTDDVIEIMEEGKRKTVAKCIPLYPSDDGKHIKRVDSLKRNNVDVVIGDTVKTIILAPLEPVPPIDERYLADALESVPVTKG
jgi:transitional endoplasmic reticulum ATPase